MKRSNSWIIQSRRNRVRFYHLSIIGLHHNAFAAVQNACCSQESCSCRFSRIYAKTASFCCDNFNGRFIYKMVKSSCCIAAATNTSDDVIWVFSSDFLFQLPFNFFRNYTLKSCHQIWKRMRTNYTSDDVMCGSSVVNPVS